MRTVLHIDMDAFFAAIEEKANPGLRGLPIVVGADPKEGRGRGVVSTCNYAARKYGIRSALPISQAWRLSEEARKNGEKPAVFLPVDGELYGETSKRIMEYLRPLGNTFEEASVDEMYLELDATYGMAKKIAQKIKTEIREREGLTCSIGIGSNKLVSKIASDLKKPDGLTAIKPEEVQKFFDPLPIRKIPGIGPKTELALNKKGIKVIRDLKQIGKEKLVEWFGKWGMDLYHKARGEDDSQVSDEWVKKSIGEQETFEKDTLRAEFLLTKLQELCERVWERFKRSEFSLFRTVTVTIRFADFETKTRSHTLAKSVSAPQILKTESIKLLFPFLDKRANPRRKLIRLLGVRIEKLV